MSFSEEIKRIEQQIAKAKTKIKGMEEARALEIGKLAIKAGITDFANKDLLAAFKSISSNAQA